MRENRIKINGQFFQFRIGETILDVAKENNIHIPTLCHLERTPPSGICGICVVEVEGNGELALSCSTPAQDSMSVWTESVRVVASRKETIRTLLASGNHNCGIASEGVTGWTDFQKRQIGAYGTDTLCPAWGDCRLQDLAYHYQVKGEGIRGDEAFGQMDNGNPVFLRDLSRCIRCGRCAAACNSVQGNNAVVFNGSKTKEMSVSNNGFPVVNDLCVSCGECVQACPVGALLDKKARYHWRPYETKKVRTTCPYCGVGCQQWLHVKDGKIVKVTGVEDAEPNHGRLCVKGRFGYDFIYSNERITDPLIRQEKHFRKVTWDEALDHVSNMFRKILNESGPSAVGGVSCARSINEDSYQMQKLFRAVFKTNNIDHCART